MDQTWEFVSYALEQSPEARAAAARGEQALATAEAMSAPLYNPEIDGGMEQFVRDDRRPSRYDVGLSMSLDVAGKSAAQSATGQAQAQGAAAEAQRARLDVVRRLLSAIATVATSRERSRNAIAQDEAAREFSDIAERSLRAGDVGEAEVDIARLSVLEAETERRATEAERLSAELDLQHLCSCDQNKAPELPEMIPAPPVLSAGELDGLIDRSVDLVIANARVDTARAELTFARRSRTPDPTVSLGVGEDDGEQLYRLGVSIPIPIFNSGEPAVRAAGHSLVAAALEAERARRDVAARIRTTYSAYLAAYANLDSWRRKGSPTVVARFDQIRRQLRAGEFSTTDYLVQLRETLSSAQRGLEVERAAWAIFADWIAVTNTMPIATGERK